MHVALQRGSFEMDARLTAAPGEVVALMGPSGAGKSTLLSVVSGLVRAARGYVRVDGADVSSARVHVPPQQRGVVLLGQQARLFPHLSARENVAFALVARSRRDERVSRVSQMSRASRRERRAEADRWLDRVGLGADAARLPEALSGGQQQRVALARALAARPRVLLLDEPFAALDPATAADVRSMLSDQVRRTGTTTVIVTHAVVDAIALADRLMLMEAGAIAQQGAPREVLTAPRTAFAATLAGVARVPGLVGGGYWRSGALTVTVPGSADGAAVLLVPSGAARIVPEQGRGAADAREERPVLWRTHVARIEATPAGARLHVSDPEADVEISAAELAAHDLAVGSPVVFALDPQLVRLAPR
ncbi:MAG TPA: ABC transporter ATP-binding protein [Microbacterium sp.]|nr:ABC transporter ATP-binding protein [Microbacterium sp.]